MEEVFWPFFHYFPWECAICRHRFRLKRREEPKDAEVLVAEPIGNHSTKK
jgi:hypothetical protein